MVVACSQNISTTVILRSIRFADPTCLMGNFFWKTGILCFSTMLGQWIPTFLRSLKNQAILGNLEHALDGKKWNGVNPKCSKGFV